MEYKAVQNFLKKLKSKILLERMLVSMIIYLIFAMSTIIVFYFFYEFIIYLRFPLIQRIILLLAIIMAFRFLIKNKDILKNTWTSYLINNLPLKYLPYQNFLLNSFDISQKNEISFLEKAYLEKGSQNLHLDYDYNISKSSLSTVFFLLASMIVLSFSSNFQSYFKQQVIDSKSIVNDIFLTIDSQNLMIHEDSTYVINYKHSIPDINEMILIVNDEDSINQKIFNINYENSSFTLPKTSYESGHLLLRAKSTFFSEVFSNKIAFTNIKKFKISSHNVTIIPPKYTNIKPYVATNINSINLIKGSLLRWQIVMNKDVKSSTSNFKENEDFVFSKRLYRPIIFSADFQDYDSTFVSYKSHKISVTTDRKPLIILRNPKTSIAVSSLEPIAFYLSGIDDFGFDHVDLQYSLFDPLVAAPSDTITQEVLSSQAAIFQKQINWKVEETNAFPGMDLYYRFIAWDNNKVDGSSKSKTEWLKIHFMSMEEMFQQLNAKQDKISKEITENLSERKKIVSELEKLQKKLKQKGNLSFEDKKEIDNLLNKLEDLNNKLKKAQEDVEKLEKQAEKEKLFSEELVSKFNELKELLKSLDLLKKEAKKKPATSMNSNELKKELNKATQSEEKMQKQLERFQSLLKKMQEKQKKEKYAQQIKDIAKKQTSINKQTKEKESSADRNQKKLKSELDNFKDSIQKTKSELLDQINDMKISENMAKSSNQEQKGKEKTRDKIEEDLNKLSEQMDSEAKADDEKEKQELLNRLKTQIDYLLMNSFKQEDLVNSSASMSVYSDKFKPFIRDQYIIKAQLDHIKKELLNISGETFLFNPKTIDVVDQAIKNSDKVIDDLEQRRQRSANQSQSKILANINQSILMLNENQKSMENAQSALGEKEFQKQMQSMADKQGQVNKQSESLWEMLKQQATDQRLSEKGKAQQQGNQNQEGQDGQSGEKGQSGMSGKDGQGGQNGQGGIGQMQSDLAQQMKELFDKAGENGSGSKGAQGRSSSMIEEMKKIAKELAKNKLDEKLIDRQKKLLQKMLDAASSGKEKKEKTKKREKENAKDFEIVDIKDLNDDFGQLNSLINQYYEKAINKKYDVYLKEMIQNYFNNLINAQNDSLQILNN